MGPGLDPLTTEQATLGKVPDRAARRRLRRPQ